MAMDEDGVGAEPKPLQGTADEAREFLTNSVTRMVAWTDMEALFDLCVRLSGLTSLDQLQEDGTRRSIRFTLLMLDFSRPLPEEYMAGWNDWLNAYLRNCPDLELLLLEEALTERWLDREAPVDASIITSAMN